MVTGYKSYDHNSKESAIWFGDYEPLTATESNRTCESSS
jgi:hypothetical protein